MIRQTLRRSQRTAVTCALFIAFYAVFAFTLARPAAANTTSCYLATSEAKHALCFLDFGGYMLASGTTTPQTYPFTIKLPDGSLVSGTLTNSGQAIGTPANNPGPGVTTGIIGLPTLTTNHNSALGDYSATTVTAGDATSTTYEGGYLGVLGKPAFYDNNTVGPIALSNMTITDSTGASEGSTITIAGADAEDTAAADYDAGTGGLYWTTTGGNLVEVQLLNQISTTTSVCAFTINALTATCIAKNGQVDPGSAYIIASKLTAASQSFSVKTITTNISAEGFAFAFELTGALNVAKTVNSRLGSDQFTVSVKHGTATAYSATTTGTATGAASTVTAGGAAVPGVAYTLSDATTSGSNPISNYVSTVSCSNATTGSTTTLPTAGTVATSVTITPAVDDQINCTFTNTALTLTNTPVNPTNTDAANASVTDLFTLKNTSLVAGTLAVTSSTVTSSTGSTVMPSGYTFNGTTYGNVTDLNNAIAAAGTTAAGGTISVGVIYATNATSASSTDTVNLLATVGSGTSTSPAATGTETDTVNALPTTTSGSNCSIATSAKAHLICWLDFAGYAGLGSETFTLKMPDGSILTGTVTNTGTVSTTPIASPDGTKPAFGNTTYLGIGGMPIFLVGATGTYSPIQISNLKLTDPLGFSVTTVGMVATDAEDTNTPGFGIQEMMNWQTTGAPWTLLETQVPSAGNAQCTLSTLPSQNVTCMGVSGTYIDDYMLRSIINTITSGNASSFSMAGETSYNQAWAYGINLSLLTSTKTVASRVASSDQFTVSVQRGVNGAANPTPTGTPIATASTSGTGTTASGMTPTYVIPNDTYVLGETMAAGSTSALSQYATTVNCTNASVTSGVTQVLPAANLAAQSVAIIPQPDAQITCAFTNTGVTMTNTAVEATAADPMTTSETDSFTLANTSAIPATFTVAAPTITPFNGTTAGTAFAPTGYTLTVGSVTTTYTTLAALNAAIAGMTATPSGGSIVVGVTYTTSTSASTSDVVSLPATDTSGTGTSAVATATESDTITPGASLAISKTGTTQTSPGGLITYTIVVTNNGPSAATGASFSDPMPAGVVVKGTPTCATTSGAAVCGSVAVSTTIPQTVTSTLGTFPNGSSVTFTITATAAAAGTYVNTASIADPAGVQGTTAMSSLTTTVAQSNGLAKTVQNLSATGTPGAIGTSNTAAPGNVLQYVLTFTNTTGQPLYGLNLTDVVPTNTTYKSTGLSCVVAQSGGSGPPCTASYTAGTTTVSGALPTKASGGSPLAAGGTVTLTFQVTVN